MQRVDAGMDDYREAIADELTAPPSEARLTPAEAVALDVVPSGPMTCPDCGGLGEILDRQRLSECPTCEGTGWS